MAEPKEPRELGAFVARVMVAAAIFGLLWFAWELRLLLLLVFGAVLVSVIFRMIARPIRDRLHVKGGIALAIAVLLVIGIIALVFWFFGAEIARQTNSLSETLPGAWQKVQTRLETAGWGEPLHRWLENVRSSAVSNLGRFALSIGNGVADTVLVIVAGIYLAAQPDLYRTGLIKLVPPRSRDLIGSAIEESGHALGLWLKGRLVSMTIVGILTASGLYLIGIPSWLSLGLLSGLLEFIPFLGPFLSAIPAVLLAFAISPQAALWTIGLYLLVQQIEGNLVEPLVQQRAVTIPPPLLLFALGASALLFGLGGVILGSPLAVVIYVLVKRLYVREALATDTPLPTDRKK
ncbi:MAG: AI-2E family transporter [Sphingomonadales bacterium]